MEEQESSDLKKLARENEQLRAENRALREYMTNNRDIAEVGGVISGALAEWRQNVKGAAVFRGDDDPAHAIGHALAEWRQRVRAANDRVLRGEI